MTNQDKNTAIHSLVKRSIHIRRLDFEELARINEEVYNLIEKHEWCTKSNNSLTKRIQSCKEYQSSPEGTREVFIKMVIATLNDLHDIETYLSIKPPPATH